MKFKTRTKEKKQFDAILHFCNWHLIFAFWPKPVLTKDGIIEYRWLEKIYRVFDIKWSDGEFVFHSPRYLSVEEATMRALSSPDALSDEQGVHERIKAGSCSSSRWQFGKLTETIRKQSE